MISSIVDDIQSLWAIFTDDSDQDDNKDFFTFNNMGPTDKFM